MPAKPFCTMRLAPALSLLAKTPAKLSTKRLPLMSMAAEFSIARCRGRSPKRKLAVVVDAAAALKRTPVPDLCIGSPVKRRSRTVARSSVGGGAIPHPDSGLGLLVLLTDAADQGVAQAQFGVAAARQDAGLLEAAHRCPTERQVGRTGSFSGDAKRKDIGAGKVGARPRTFSTTTASRLSVALWARRPK